MLRASVRTVSFFWDDGIRIYLDSFNKPEKTLKSTWVTSIASRSLGSKTEFVFIRHETDERVVCKASSDFSKQEEIVRFSLPGEDAAFLAASTCTKKLHFIVTRLNG